MLSIRLICLLSLLIASAGSAVTMSWTPVGNPGNPADTNSHHIGNTDLCGINNPCGVVPYAYYIGTFEVTNAQYVEFLNAKAQSDPLALYNTQMGGFDPTRFGFNGGITRSGSDGSYTYSTITGRADVPVNYVSFYNALRFANWMNNGQGNASTETGSYMLLGGTETPSNGNTVMRSAGATIFLPTGTEWYKAAFYDPGSASYFDYPAGSNTQTICGSPTAVANHANCLSRDVTAVGSYTGSPSPFGTFDQGGNVREWNEAICPRCTPTLRGIRGGEFGSSPDDLSAGRDSYTTPDSHYGSVGFRLVLIPEPSTGLLVVAGLAGLASWRRASA